MNYKTSLLESICKHPSVSRAMSGKYQGAGVEKLVVLRRALRDIKRAKRNARDEHGIASSDNGVTGPFSSPSDRLLREALAAGLPDDLASLVKTALQS